MKKFSFKKVKLFTLIELIVVIVVLGILAAIVIPNISSFQEEASQTAVESNARNIQTSVDMYALKNNGAKPVNDEPTELVPQPIELDKLKPNYLRDLPKVKGAKYWLDEFGTVWFSTIDAPIIKSTSAYSLEWEPVTDAVRYNVYEVEGYVGETGKVTSAASSSKNSYKYVDTTEGTKMQNLIEGKAYVVTSVDKHGFESAPSGFGYNGYDFYLSQPEVPTEEDTPPAPPIVMAKEHYFSFDGNDLINTNLKPSQLGIEGTKSKTVEFWVRPTYFNSTNTVFSMGSAEYGREFALGITGVNKFRAQFWGGDTHDIDFTVDSANKWTHIAMVQEGSIMKIYANGQLVGNRTATYNLSDVATLQIGRWNSQNGFHFVGDLDDFRVWNIARSQADIQANMDRELTGNEAGLMANWQFNELINGTTIDSTTNKYSATVSGATYK